MLSKPEGPGLEFKTSKKIPKQNKIKKDKKIPQFKAPQIITNQKGENLCLMLTLLRCDSEGMHRLIPKEIMRLWYYLQAEVEKK